jgi:hypothetical protein
MRFIYMKTARTASTSVEVYFEPWCVPEGKSPLPMATPQQVSKAGVVGYRGPDLEERAASVWQSHMSATTVRGLVGERVWDDYFKFAVVRNPFDRLASLYNFTVRRGLIGEGRRFPIGPPIQDTLRERFRQWLTWSPRWIRADRSHYMIDGQFCLDDVIKFESLHEGLERICKRLDIEYRAEALRHLHAAGARVVPTEDYYCDETVELVREAYADVMEMFGYSVPWL